MTGFDLCTARNAQGTNWKIFELLAEALEVTIFVHFLAVNFVTLTIEPRFERLSAATAAKTRILAVVFDSSNELSASKRHVLLLSCLSVSVTTTYALSSVRPPRFRTEPKLTTDFVTEAMSVGKFMCPWQILVVNTSPNFDDDLTE